MYLRNFWLEGNITYLFHIVKIKFSYLFSIFISYYFMFLRYFIYIYVI